MRRFLPLAALLAFWVAPAPAIDHDNVDAGRPLSFDDAESIAFRERAFEFGLSPYLPYRTRTPGVGLAAEFLYGIRVNTQVSLDFDSSFGGRAGSDDRRADFGDVGVGFLHNLNRETLTKPAFALRTDAYLPTGRGSQGIGVRVRGIMSRTFNQYSRVHVNLDGNFQTKARDDERNFAPALIVGVTRPIGYPTRFNRTALGEIGIRQGAGKNDGAIFSAGVGIRQQVTVRSVFDVGLQSDFAATKSRTPRNDVRLIAGYSTSF